MKKRTKIHWTTEEEDLLVPKVTDLINTLKGKKKVDRATSMVAKELQRSTSSVKNRYYKILKRMPETHSKVNPEIRVEVPVKSVSLTEKNGKLVAILVL